LSPDDWRDLPFCYLTTIGRRTGRPHRIEIWFAAGDGVVYLLAGDGDRSDWVRNINANPDVTLELAGRTTATRARMVTGSREDREARSAVAGKYRARGEGDLDEWERTALPVAIHWPG